MLKECNKEKEVDGEVKNLRFMIKLARKKEVLPK